MIKWSFIFEVWVRMKFMFMSVEMHKYIKEITYLEKSHTCNRNWKQRMIPTPNLFSVVQACLCCFHQSNQTCCSHSSVISRVLQKKFRVCLIRDLATRSSVNVLRKKKGQKWVPRMVHNFKGNSWKNGINNWNVKTLRTSIYYQTNSLNKLK